MSQIIIISDSKIVSSLYEANLKVYVDVNSTIKDSKESALELLKHLTSVDAIICFNESSKEKNVFDTFYNELKKIKTSIPLIAVGDVDQSKYQGTLVVKNKYDLKAVIQAMAKILQVSAKEMATKAVPEYYPVPTLLLSKLKKSEFDIYYRHEKVPFEYEYFLVKEKNAELSEELSKYTKEGVPHLFIDSKERLKFINATSKLIIDVLEEERATAEDKVVIASQGIDMIAEDIFENEVISEEVAAISNSCVKAVDSVIKDVPKLGPLLKLLLSSNTGYVYVHSVLATFISSKIIKNMSWGSAEQQSKISFALFFHDIFLVPIFAKYPDIISEKDLLSDPRLTDADKKIVNEHANLASSMIKTYPKAPIGVDVIINQHHGMTNGIGFTDHFREDISPLSKVIMIAEEVAEGILEQIRKKDKDLFNREELLPKLREKYKSHSYRKIIDSLEKLAF